MNLSESEIRRILKQRADELAKPPAQHEAIDKKLELVSFSIGVERYALATRLVHEVQPLNRLNWTRLPGAPDFIVGVVNLRGRLYSLMDIGNYFKLPPRPISATAHVLHVSGGTLNSGGPLELCILADDLPEVQTIPTNTLSPAPDHFSAKAQTAVYGLTPEMLVVLALDQILSDPAIIVEAEA